MGFLHGVETIEIELGPREIKVVKSAVILLVGISPVGPVNEPTLVLGTRDAAKFGAEVPGFNIPQSLDAIFKQGPATVLVINTLNVTTNTTEVIETLTITNNKVKLATPAVGEIVVTSTDGLTTYVDGTDYKVSVYGEISVLSYVDISIGQDLKITYKKLDEATITSAQIIGATDATTGERTGLQLGLNAENIFGFSPKIIITPGFSQLNGVGSAMKEIAVKTRGVAVIDAPAGSNFQTVITGRGPAGVINFNVSDPHIILTYPRLLKYDPYTGNNIAWWLSAFWAGVKSSTDLNPSKGYHHSPSNIEINGTEGVEVNLTSSISDPQSETNVLNENGVVTVFKAFGTGLRMWGNRNSSYPTSTKVDNFISVRATANIIEESIEKASLQFLDRPINKAIIDTIRLSVNAFIRGLVQRGVVVDGECVYDEQYNTAVELSAGHVTFTYSFMPPTPMERITYRAQLDINLLTKVIS